MSFTEKMATKMAEVLGGPALAVAQVVPPGATLYRSYAPKSAALALGGPLFAAFASKAEGAAEGLAGQVPRQQGFLALTPSQLVFVSKKALGVAPKEVVAGWDRTGMTLTFSKGDKWPYPGLAIGFADGSTALVFGDKKWGLDEIAAAAAG